ncbi:MAG: cytidylate kinase-like family protein [Clostridiales bacterium]|nr:cytidylate kinase-like family protein [Clostridiales bacterium]
MANHVIFSIGRLYGSGGHELGERLAAELNIPLYDRGIVNRAAEQIHISSQSAQEEDRRSSNRFFAYTPVEYIGFDVESHFGKPLSEEVYQAQVEIVHQAAAQGSCVIVGRCADVILEQEPGLIDVFLTAKREDRVRRLTDKFGLTERKAQDQIRKIDRERRYYYELHTARDWASWESHQIMLNLSRLGADRALELMVDLYKRKEKELRGNG